MSFFSSNQINNNTGHGNEKMALFQGILQRIEKGALRDRKDALCNVTNKYLENNKYSFNCRGMAIFGVNKLIVFSYYHFIIHPNTKSCNIE